MDKPDEENTMNWIRVEDSLPPEGESVDVFSKEEWRQCDVKYTKGIFQNYVYDYDDDFSHMEKIDNVTHWMHSPRHPQ